MCELDPSLVNRTVCFLFYEVSHFLWFCHKAINFVVPGESCSHWAPGSRVIGMLLSFSRPQKFSFTLSDTTADLNDPPASFAH